MFDFTMDVCKMTRNTKIQFLTWMIPDYATLFEKWIHPCPLCDFTGFYNLLF
jgi:hypothetical protein